MANVITLKNPRADVVDEIDHLIDNRAVFLKGYRWEREEGKKPRLVLEFLAPAEVTELMREVQEKNVPTERLTGEAEDARSTEGEAAPHVE